MSPAETLVSESNIEEKKHHRYRSPIVAFEI